MDKEHKSGWRYWFSSFALMFVLPVKHIPREAVKYYDKSDGSLYVGVHTNKCRQDFLQR